MDLFERNPKRWCEVYFYGAKTPINSGQALGKKMADGLEDGDLTGDPVLDLVIEMLPKFEIMDKIIEDPNGVEVDYIDKKTGELLKLKLPVLNYKGNKIPILAKPDTRKKDLSAFKEYKTSQEPWTQKRADDNEQVTYYATTGFLITGKIIGDIEVVVANTEKQGIGCLDAKIGATGGIQRFVTYRPMGRILRMMSRMGKAWVGMSKMCEELL